LAERRFSSHRVNQSKNRNGAINPRHFLIRNSAEKGIFYSFND